MNKGQNRGGMTRFYYTDPLSAAWMAKHFDFYYEEDYAQPISRQEVWSRRIAQGGDQRWHVHPDSLHLLEPRVGDMITHFGLRAWRIDSMDAFAYFHPNMPNEIIGRFTLKADKPAIIQRDSKPFFWPDGEAA